jgi:hypothetical protein
MDFDLLYPKRFLKAGMFGGRDVTLTIAKVFKEVLEGDKGPKNEAILSFVERPQQLTLNKTNGHCLKAMFGRETDAWIGKRITLYPLEYKTEFSDLAIRVRGSPDLQSSVTFTLKLPKKKPREITLVVTRAGALKPLSQTQQAQPQPDDSPPPPSDLDVPQPEEP